MASTLMNTVLQVLNSYNHELDNKEQINACASIHQQLQSELDSLNTLQPGAIQLDNPTQKLQDHATVCAKAITTYAEKPLISPQKLVNLLSGQLQKKMKPKDAALQHLYQGYALTDNWVSSIWSLCIFTSLSSQGDLLTKFTQGLESHLSVYYTHC
jgi:hypothetical protein